VTGFLDDGTQRSRSGDWHFGWVLEGRAIQDVWIVPPRGRRGHDATGVPEYYGTTLPIYNPRSDDRRVLYIDPAIRAVPKMTGRRQCDAIVQLGHDAAGQSVRWGFDEIEATAFRWRGEWSADGGTTRQIARRIPHAAPDGRMRRQQPSFRGAVERA